MPKHRKAEIPKFQRCVVCYSEFYPYPITPSKWESSTTKLFYSALGIPPLRLGDDEDGEEDADSVVSLPYCPQCHTKIGLMFNLRCQLEAVQHQYECIRNEIAFLVVETITQNCRNGPTDFIRQQIYEKWREYHEEEKLKEDYGNNIGLDAMFEGYHSVGETDEDMSNMDMSNNSDLVNLKTENNGNITNEERQEAPEHEEYEDHVASMMELEMQDGMDYETQMQLQEQQRQALKQEQQQLHLQSQQQKQYKMNKNRSHVSLAPNAVHTVVPVPTTKMTTKYSQASARVPSSTDQNGLGSSENNLESDVEAAAVASETVKGFTRVSSMRGRGGGRGRKRLASNENFESEAAALASETVKGFTRVTTIRGRGRGGRSRRGFGNMPRLTPASGQTNQTVSNSSNNLSQPPLKYLRGRGSRGGIVRRTRGSISLIASPKNSASPPPTNHHHSHPPPSTNATATLQSPNRPAKAGLRCHLCKKKFPYATLLKLHFLTHTKKNPSHCDTDVEPKEPVDSTHWKTP